MDQLDLVREFLLRLPPDEPACLVRASLVCKNWRSILSNPAFIHLYRALHQTPPLMGFFQNVRFNDDDDHIRRFVPTVVPSPLAQLDLQFLKTKTVIDCRHGLVLLRLVDDDLVVWDSVTRLQHHLPPVPEGPFRHDYFSAAVICAAARCDHLDCRGSPFRVIFAGTESTDEDTVIWISIYSSENKAWTAPTAGCLYFRLDRGHQIVRYALDGDVLSEIDPPPKPLAMVLMATMHGGLGAAGVVNYNLHIWSRRPVVIGADAWVLDQVISLETLITLRIGNPETILHVIGFAEMGGYLFITTHDQIYSLDLKSGRLKKITENGTYLTVFPYECFYTLP